MFNLIYKKRIRELEKREKQVKEIEEQINKTQE
jgi:hypothetical protein